MHWIERTLELLQWIAERIIILAFAIMVISILATVFTRNISISITWFEELSRFMMIWLVGLGFAVSLRAGLLSGAEVLLVYLPRRLSRWVVIGAKCVILTICVLVLLSGWDLLAHLDRSGQVSSNLRVPMTWVYAGLWLGFALSAVFVAGSLVLEVMGHKDLMARRFATSIQTVQSNAMEPDARQILSEVAPSNTLRKGDKK